MSIVWSIGTDGVTPVLYLPAQRLCVPSVYQVVWYQVEFVLGLAEPSETLELPCGAETQPQVLILTEGVKSIARSRFYLLMT